MYIQLHGLEIGSHLAKDNYSRERKKHDIHQWLRDVGLCILPTFGHICPKEDEQLAKMCSQLLACFFFQNFLELTKNLVAIMRL